MMYTGGKYADFSYTGDWKDGKMHGHGVLNLAYLESCTEEEKLYCQDDLKWVKVYSFEGNWKDDMRNGHGV